MGEFARDWMRWIRQVGEYDWMSEDLGHDGVEQLKLI